jgi:hypothetical protein
MRQEAAVLARCAVIDHEAMPAFILEELVEPLR